MFLWGAVIVYFKFFAQMKYFLVAGEASGDLHGSNLIAALAEQDNKAEFAFWGGDLMADKCGKKPQEKK